MIEPGRIKNTDLSLSEALTRRVFLISFIGVAGLLCTVILTFYITLHQVHDSMDRTNADAVRKFDGFFLNIESGLEAFSEGLSSHNDKNLQLLALRARNRAFLDALFLGPDGTILAQRNAFGRPKLVKIDRADWLRNPPPFGKVLIGPLCFEGETPYVDMGITATDDIGLPGGLLLVRVDLTALWNSTLDIKAGKTGYAYIADSSGQLVAFRNRKLLESGNNLQKLVGRLPQEITRSQLSLYKGLSSQLVLASAQPLQTVPWFAIVEHPVFEALSPFIFPAFILLTALITVVLMLSGTIRFTRFRIVTPLLALRDAVVHMAEGNLKQNVYSPHNDELGQLARSFNLMAEQLQQAFVDLEDQIKTLQKTQTELQESEFRIRSISNNLTAGMIYQVIARPDGSRQFTYLSDSVKRLYGISPEEGMADPELIYGKVMKEERELLMKAEDEAFKNNSAFKAEVRIQEPSGGIRWSAIASTPRKLDDSSTIWDGVEFIITDQKRAEEEIKNSQKLFRDAVEYQPIPITITRGNIIIHINQKATETYGYTLEDIPTLDIWQSKAYPDPEYRNEVIEMLKKDIQLSLDRNHSTPDRERRIICKDGTAKYSLFNGRQIDQLFIWSFVDITDRKRTEEELQKRMEELVSWHKVTLGRESRVMELKNEVNELLEKQGKPPRYGKQDK